MDHLQTESNPEQEYGSSSNLNKNMGHLQTGSKPEQEYGSSINRI